MQGRNLSDCQPRTPRSMAKADRKPDTGSTTHRFVGAAFGVFFIAVAIALFVLSDRTIGPLLAAVALGLLGIDAMVSACRNTRSLLSRIGPLP